MACLLCFLGCWFEPQYVSLDIFGATQWQVRGGTMMNSHGLYAATPLLLYWIDFCPVIWKMGFSLAKAPSTSQQGFFGETCVDRTV